MIRRAALLLVVALLLLEGLLWLLSFQTARDLMPRVIAQDVDRLARIADPLDPAPRIDSDYAWREYLLWGHARGGHGIPTLVMSPHPTRGWWNLPDLDNRRLRTFSVSTNRHGHRSPHDSYDRPHTVFLLGDSFTFGTDLNDEETWPSLLDGKLDRVNVINLAAQGYAADQMLVVLREALHLWSPDLIIVSLVSLDLARARLSFRDFAKPRFQVIDGSLQAEAGALPSDLEGTVALASSSNEWLRPLHWSRIGAIAYYLAGGYGDIEARFALNMALLREMARLAETRDVPIRFVMLPAFKELDVETWRTEGEDFIARAEAEGVRIVNARPAMKRAFPDHRGSSSHYTAAEAAVVAGLMEELIREALPGLLLSQRPNGTAAPPPAPGNTPGSPPGSKP